MKTKILLLCLIPITYVTGFRNGTQTGLVYTNLVIYNKFAKFNNLEPDYVVYLNEQTNYILKSGYVWLLPFTSDPKLSKEHISRHAKK